LYDEEDLVNHCLAPYLQLVKICVEDKAQYTQMLNNPSKEEEKTEMLENLMNSVYGI
jgi:hypothetical protein